VRAGTIAVALAAAAFGACGEDHPPAPEGSREVTIPSTDGGELAATVAGDGTNAVVISHGVSTTRRDYYAIAAKFAAGGFTAVAYDARGDHRRDDLAAAVAWARDQGATKVALLGGSHGGCISIVYAAELDADAIVTLSAGGSCEGRDAVEYASQFGDIRAQFVAAEGDSGFIDTTRALATATGTEPVIVDGGGHGNGVTDDHPEILDDLVAFVHGVFDTP
jgi:dienelactone hydrolase